MPPQRKSGGKILRDGFCVFTRITGLAFHSDAWTLILVFQRDVDLVFRTLDILVLQRIRSGFSDFGLFTLVLHSDTVRFFWTLDWFFYRILDYLIMCFRLLL
jgi:hypothetical protein